MRTSPQAQAATEIKSKRARNKLVKSTKFNIPTGPGAEDRADFVPNWLDFLTSDGVAKDCRERIASQIIKAIAETGKDLAPDADNVVRAVLNVPNEKGKRACARASHPSRASIPRPPRASRLAPCASCCSCSPSPALASTLDSEAERRRRR